MTTRRGYEEMKHRYILTLFAGGEEVQGPFASLTREVEAIAETKRHSRPDASVAVWYMVLASRPFATPVRS